MSKAVSKDSTEIAYDKQGQGPAVILVDGTLTYRSFGSMPELAKLLSTKYTVFTYDRRGRGESNDDKSYNNSYAVEREIEDIEALIALVDGPAYLYGISSGGCLSIEAAIKLGDKIKKLAIYEVPYKSPENPPGAWRDYHEQLQKLLTENRRGDAVALFMAFVGTPANQIEGMRKTPVWSVLEAVAPTLLYDASAMGGADRSVPVERLSHITASTLVMCGGAGAPFMKETALVIKKAIPKAEYRILEGQTHAVASKVVAPVLTEFFSR